MLITELMPGGDLGTRIHKDTSLPRMTGWYRQGRYVLLGLARGLAYLHSIKVIWFDCKPGNVLLNRAGTIAKISDVGLSKMLAGSQTETALVSVLPNAFQWDTHFNEICKWSTQIFSYHKCIVIAVHLWRHIYIYTSREHRDFLVAERDTGLHGPRALLFLQWCWEISHHNGCGRI